MGITYLHKTQPLKPKIILLYIINACSKLDYHGTNRKS